MSTPVNLPALGESVTEGTVTRWLKQVGDTVAVDEPLLEVSTDKVDTEIPSPVAGTLLEINAEEDDTVEVGAQLCVVGEEGEGSGGSEESDSADEAAQAGSPPSPTSREPATSRPRRHRATPVTPTPTSPATNPSRSRSRSPSRNRSRPRSSRRPSPGVTPVAAQAPR